MSKSFSIVDAEKVLAACSSYLTSRQRRIGEKIDKAVKAEMSKWLFAAKTEDEARARLSEHIELLNWTGGYWASQVEDLKLVASMSADGKVRLTADDAGILEGHWPNEGEENG